MGSVHVFHSGQVHLFRPLESRICWSCQAWLGRVLHPHTHAGRNNRSIIWVKSETPSPALKSARFQCSGGGWSRGPKVHTMHKAPLFDLRRDVAHRPRNEASDENRGARASLATACCLLQFNDVSACHNGQVGGFNESSRALASWGAPLQSHPRNNQRHHPTLNDRVKCLLQVQFKDIHPKSLSLAILDIRLKMKISSVAYFPVSDHCGAL